MYKLYIYIYDFQEKLHPVSFSFGLDKMKC